MRLPTLGNPENGKADFFGLLLNGFTGGTPGVEAATALKAEQMNAIAGELMSLVRSMGMPIDATRYDQIAIALRAERELAALVSLSPVTVFAAADVNAVTTNNTGRIVAVGGAGGKIATSDDMGASWTQRTADAFVGTLNDVCWSEGAGLFVAVGTGGVVQISTDGTSWTKITSGVTTDLLYVAYDATTDKIMTVGGTGTGDACVLTCSDGITWVSRSIVSSNLVASALTSVAGVWVLSGQIAGSTPTRDTTAFYSADGAVTAWNSAILSSGDVLSSDEYVQRVARAGGNVFATVVDSVTSLQRLVRTENRGVTWDSSPIPSLLAAVSYSIGEGAAHSVVVVSNSSTEPCPASLDHGDSFNTLLVPGGGSVQRAVQLSWTGYAGDDENAPSTRLWALVGTGSDAGKLYVSRPFVA